MGVGQGFSGIGGPGTPFFLDLLPFFWLDPHLYKAEALFLVLALLTMMCGLQHAENELTKLFADTYPCFFFPCARRPCIPP